MPPPTTLPRRLARLRPYLRSGRTGLIGAALGSLVAAATEPAIPALLQPLLDRGFDGPGLPLWLVPLVIVALFGLRAGAGFVAEYGLAWAAQRAVLALRRDLFAHLLASPALLAPSSSAPGSHCASGRQRQPGRSDARKAPKSCGKRWGRRRWERRLERRGRRWRRRSRRQRSRRRRSRRERWLRRSRQRRDRGSGGRV